MSQLLLLLLKRVRSGKKCLVIACKLVSLKYELEGNSISGDVTTDVLNIFIMPIDDTTPHLSSEYIIENGIHQGKYLKGSRWTVRTNRFNEFPGALYIVGLYSNNSCATRPLFVNLPLNKCNSPVYHGMMHRHPRKRNLLRC